ncbi:MAG: cation transporter [Lachnospiraceae bacterium]|nr:cation transporter [Lachnospiraceae bacterium]
MLKIKLKVDGMMCGMCESHINDAIRSKFSVKKVTSSHAKGETIVITEEDIEEKLKAAINDTGYTVVKIEKSPYEKKGFLSKFCKKYSKGV